MSPERGKTAEELRLDEAREKGTKYTEVRARPQPTYTDEQLAAICNRVVVISRGRVLSELAGDEVTTDRIAERCYTSMPMPISKDGSQATLDGGSTPAFRSSQTPLA